MMARAITYWRKLVPAGQAPAYATSGSAGADLASAEETVIMPGERKLVGTGIAVEFNDSFALMVLPRSGLALKHGVTVLNAPGTIDSDYRGEIKVLLVNHGNSPYKVEVGHKIAQAVLVDIGGHGTWKEKDVLSGTARGTGGFGSSGV
jgi:dUTP pyrophosphatase